MSHAHPTFAEAIKEAALAATDNRALHAKTEIVKPILLQTDGFLMRNELFTLNNPL
jgi:hypothetical protein